MPRIFVAQTLVDSWLSTGSVSLERDLLRVSGPTPVDLFINPAVWFERIDGGEADPHDVVGRVKTSQELAQMGAEHWETSVVIGDDYAYTVRPGFIATVVDARGAEVRLDGPAWGRLVQQIEGLGTSSDS